jgi:hypothetical protein
MLKKAIFKTSAVIMSFVAIVGCNPSIPKPTVGQSAGKMSRAQQIDQQIQDLKTLERRYSMNEYVNDDDASRLIDMDWLQSQEDLKQEERDEQIVARIKQKIQALQQEKAALSEK